MNMNMIFPKKHKQKYKNEV